MVGYEEEVKIVVALTYGGGYTFGYSIEHKVSQGIEIEGVVGSFENLNDWTNNQFGWGLMMIPQHFGDQHYNLVTYWVE